MKKLFREIRMLYPSCYFSADVGYAWNKEDGASTVIDIEVFDYIRHLKVHHTCKTINREVRQDILRKMKLQDRSSYR